MHRVAYKIPYVPDAPDVKLYEPYRELYEYEDKMPYAPDDGNIVLSQCQFMVFSHLFLWPNPKVPFFRIWERDDKVCDEPRPLYIISCLESGTRISYEQFIGNPFHFKFGKTQVHQKVFLWAYTDIVQKRFETPSRAESFADLDRMAASFLKMTKKEIELGLRARKSVQYASLPLQCDTFPAFYVRYESFVRVTPTGLIAIKVIDNEHEKDSKAYTIFLASQIPFDRRSVDRHKPYIHVITYTINTLPKKPLLLIATKIRWIKH